MDAGDLGSFAGYRLVAQLRSDALGQVFVADHRAPPYRDVVRIFGIDAGRAWTSGRWLTGQPLAGGRRPDAEALSIARGVALALDHAHGHQIAHGDLSPAQIVLTEAGPDVPGGVVVVDTGLLGLAGRPVLNPLAGVPSYTAPEVIAGAPVSPAIDQYSLACILFEMFSGHSPFAAPNVDAVIAGHQHRPAPPIGAFRADLAPMDPVFARALSKDPAQRYSSCAEFVERLASAAPAPPVARHAAPEPAAPATPPPATPAPVTTGPDTSASVPDSPALPTVIPDTPERIPQATDPLPRPYPVAVGSNPPAAPSRPAIFGDDAAPPSQLYAAPTEPVSAPQQPRSSRRSWRILWAALVLGAVAMIAVAATWFVVGRDSAPAQVTTTSVSTANNTTCAIRSGQLFCWGANEGGVVGNGNTEMATAPVQVAGLEKVSSVSLGWRSACAIADGSLYCWGDNAQGQLGDGTTEARLSPTKVDGLSGVTSVSVGTIIQLPEDAEDADISITTCAVAAGQAYCWGANSAGQIGDGTTDERRTPVKVSGIGDVSMVASDSRQTCALTRAGDVYCWGLNYVGQLADGTTTERHAPVRVGGLPAASTLATAVGSTCVVADSALYCWGTNGFEQLGNNSRRRVFTPTKVDGLGAVTQVAMGTQTTCAIVDNKPWCWGGNSSREAGSDPREYFGTPMEISGVAGDVSAIATESLTSCAVAGQKVYCWGGNSKGQRGIGSTEFALEPTEVAF